ncbi:MAG: YHS domain-containing protein [Edaphocola sp.]
MKKICTILAATLMFAACGNSSTKAANEATTPAQEAAQPESNAAATSGAKDPVCGMEKDAGWTDFSVNNTDTTWFCSPHCKETFDKDPAKYTAAPAKG